MKRTGTLLYILTVILVLWSVRGFAESAGPPKKDRERVVLHTNAGDLVVALYPEVAPIAVAQFRRLVSAGVYNADAISFLQRGFLAEVQFPRDRTPPLSSAQSALIQTMPKEFSVLHHRRGILSMSRNVNDPDSAQGAFCILLGDEPQLDGKYTIFGEVEFGDDVLGAMEQIPVAADGHTPLTALVITTAEVVDPIALRKMKLVKARDLSGIPAAHAMGASCHPSPPETAFPAKSMTAANAAVVPIPITDPSIQVLDSTGTNGDRIKTVVFKNLLIDRIYPSMNGPWKNQAVRLLSPQESRFIWITGYSAEVVDEKSGEASQEFMCHTNLSLVGAPGAPTQFQQIRSQLSISQGQKEVSFPQGMALRMENIPERAVGVMAMVLNNNYREIQRILDFKATVRYVDDQAAARRQLVPLFQTAVYTYCVTVATDSVPGETVCTPASPPETSTWLDGRERTGHWMVPPGRHRMTQDVTGLLKLPYDSTLNYIWMHVHPYAESVELTDTTTGKTVWKGTAKNPKDPAIAQIISTEKYSSTVGIPLYQNHRYAFTSVYNNRTVHPIDAMAALWMYVRERPDDVSSH